MKTNREEKSPGEGVLQCFQVSEMKRNQQEENQVNVTPGDQKRRMIP